MKLYLKLFLFKSDINMKWNDMIKNHPLLTRYQCCCSGSTGNEVQLQLHLLSSSVAGRCGRVSELSNTVTPLWRFRNVPRFGTGLPLPFRSCVAFPAFNKSPASLCHLSNVQPFQLLTSFQHHWHSAFLSESLHATETEMLNSKYSGQEFQQADDKVLQQKHVLSH